MNDFYVVGDLHQETSLVESFLQREKPNKVIWLGDFLDSHKGDNGPFDTIKTGVFLSFIIRARLNDVFLLGNHELPYIFNNKEDYMNWGFTHVKNKAFHSQFDRGLWSKFKIFHSEEFNGLKLLFSHAGFKEKFLPNGLFDKEFLERVEKITLAGGNKLGKNPWLDDVFGPLWVRWDSLKVVYGVCQIVGHTTYGEPTIKKLEDTPYWNLNLDCAARYIAHFKDNNIYKYNLKTGEERLLDL